MVTEVTDPMKATDMESLLVAMKQNELPYPWMLATAINCLSNIQAQSEQAPTMSTSAIIMIIDALLIPYTESKEEEEESEFEAKKKKLDEEYNIHQLTKAMEKADKSFKLFMYHVKLFRLHMSVIGYSELKAKGYSKRMMKMRKD